MSTWAPGWYPDPLGRHDHRYWDGREWTHHVGSGGQTSIDPVYAAPPAPAQQQPPGSTAEHAGQAALPQQQPRQRRCRSRPPSTAVRTDKRVQKQLRKLGVTDGSYAGDDSWLDEPVLVVNQKGKLLEVNAEYSVHDRSGRQVGTVREVGQSLAKKAFTPTTARAGSTCSMRRARSSSR